jgi:hypothetical protein
LESEFPDYGTEFLAYGTNFPDRELRVLAYGNQLPGRGNEFLDRKINAESLESARRTESAMVGRDVLTAPGRGVKALE